MNNEAVISSEIYYREKQVLTLFVPVSRSTWWRWIREGNAPAPVHIGKRITVWRKSDLELWLHSAELQSVNSNVATGA